MRKRNWKHYNKSLVQRGSLTFLIDAKMIKNLRVTGKKGVGRPLSFSDTLILLLLTIKTHFCLPYRSLEGFAKWAFSQGIADIDIPTYSLICKRAMTLKGKLPPLSHRRPAVVALDASGLKVYGEGEWKVKIHGRGRPRKWIKFHIALDVESQEIVAHQSTTSRVHDGKMTKPLLDQVKGKIKTVLADGAYDGKNTRTLIKERGAMPLVPPPKNGRIGRQSERNDAIRVIKGLGGDKEARSIWGKLTGYSKRALVETAFSRMKRLYGPGLWSRSEARQEIEVHIRCLLLNKMQRQTA